MGLRLPIKVKTAIALSVPLAMLVGVGGLEVVQSSRELRELREQTDLATAAIGPSGLITAIQNERNFTGLWLLGSENLVNLPVNSLEGARAATDRAYQAFQDEVARKGGEVARTYASALAALEGEGGLASQRELVDSYDGPRLVTVYNATADRSFGGYTVLVGALADPTTRLTSGIEDEELRRGVQLIDMASRELDRIARFVRLALLQAVRGDGRIAGRAEVQEVSLAQSEADRSHLEIVDLASHGRYRHLGEELRIESEETQFIQITREIVRTGEIPITAMLEGISISDDESYYGFLTDVSEVLRDRADELNTAARDRQRRLLAVAALVLVAAVVVMPLMTRSITRPLRSLTRQATDLARRRLPEAVRQVQEAPLGRDVTTPELEPVTVPARDEVADVAHMLTQVQSTAIELAVGQAVLRRNVADALVNLARRNQNLLGRQLTFITELETHETSPETLGNLFRLDHLATRMRRNAESLLVLAGVEQQRHATAPAPLTDVIRAALGEVDDYHRVVFPAVQPVTIDGPAVADLAHLLAELIENALRFSPPEVPVEIRGHTYLAADAYLVSIIDQGVGMTADEIALANRRLAQAEDFTVAPSSYLGHYVTAALAARHGVTVTLAPTLPSAAHPGITARVQLPRRLLARGGRPPLGAGPRRPDQVLA